MPRSARIVLPGYPYHITQRGNRRQQVFFRPDDKEVYLRILELSSRMFDLEVWAYCLMDNHVHLIVCPRSEEGLTRAIGETHRLYTRMINLREGWRGYLWQGRFRSFIMDEPHLFAAMRYVERNPVRARMVERPQDYKWSSAAAHVFGTKNRILTKCFLEGEISDWEDYLRQEENERELKEFREHGGNGRPLGSAEFLQKVGAALGRKFN